MVTVTVTVMVGDRVTVAVAVAVTVMVMVDVMFTARVTVMVTVTVMATVMVMVTARVVARMKHRPTTALMLCSFVLMGAICFFIFGFMLSMSAIEKNKTDGLIIIVISFVIGLISAVGVMKYKAKINTIIQYGAPVYNAAEKIKEIVHQVNVYGVGELQEFIEKIMKDEFVKIRKKETGK
jgi:hypothetical protein